MSRKALVIGIDDYKKNPLSGCVNDANLIASLLEEHEDRSKNFDVKKKFNIESKGSLMSEIKKLFSGNHEIALLYFSGHGYNDETGQFICTPDGSPDDPGLDLSKLLEIVNFSNSTNRIVILDSCFSGGMGKCKFVQNADPIGNGVTILSACKQDETSVESNGHGIFTTLLAEALKGGASDLIGNITPGSIYAFIDKSLGAWEQRPVFKTNVENFVSLRRVKPPVDLSDLKAIPYLFREKHSDFQLDPSYEFTNNPDIKPSLKEPYSTEENIKKFKILQRLESVGLVQPVGEEHMYFAAMNSKSCKLTPLGQYYWDLANKKRF